MDIKGTATDDSGRYETTPFWDLFEKVLLMKQQTIKNPDHPFRYRAAYRSLAVHMTLKPAAADTGVSFVRTDLPGQPSSCSDTVDRSHGCEGRPLLSAIEYQGARVYTIEHIMAALTGMGFDNVVIEIDGEEVPGMDGSSLEFVKAFTGGGICPTAGG
jgi:UDP-3-O-[3-hydroxymyristoyl] N-acetylglucosamine deacetylase/3-hydroxyacyl-[acyl-carrier-protein] dehydratase